MKPRVRARSGHTYKRALPAAPSVQRVVGLPCHGPRPMEHSPAPWRRRSLTRQRVGGRRPRSRVPGPLAPSFPPPRPPPLPHDRDGPGREEEAEERERGGDQPGRPQGVVRARGLRQLAAARQKATPPPKDRVYPGSLPPQSALRRKAPGRPERAGAEEDICHSPLPLLDRERLTRIPTRRTVSLGSPRAASETNRALSPFSIDGPGRGLWSGHSSGRERAQGRVVRRRQRLSRLAGSTEGGY